MPEEYLKDILAVYDYKKAEGTLPPNLVYPTPGNLKDQCLIVYRERYNSADDDVLNLFFTASDKEKGYTKSIQNCNVNDFRQVKKILNKEISSPGVKFIEIIAWLIDFKPRPSILYYKNPDRNKTTNHINVLVPVEKEPAEQNSGKFQMINQVVAEIENQNPTEVQVIEQVTDETVGQKTEVVNPDKGIKETETKPAKPIRSIVIAGIVLFLVGGSTFFFWKKKQDIVPNTLFSQKCMYWTGDRYEPVDCNEKVNNVSIIPLDTQKLNRLQKITSPDTLTTNALGKVWYTKIAGEHQFFTDSGVHPLDTQKKLKPVTRYILSNHVSYYRYLLTLVIWSICVIILISLCSVFFIAFRKRRKKRMLILTSPKMLA